MSESSAELHYGSAGADAGTLDLPAGEPAAGRRFEGHAGDASGDEGTAGARLRAAVSAGFARLRAGFVGLRRDAAGAGAATTASARQASGAAAADAGVEQTGAAASDRPGVDKPLWRRKEALAAGSAVAIALALVGGVALRSADAPSSPAATEKGLEKDAGLMAPAAKLAGVALPRPSGVVVEVPAETPPAKSTEEVTALWRGGAAKDAQNGAPFAPAPGAGAPASTGAGASAPVAPGPTNAANAMSAGGSVGASVPSSVGNPPAASGQTAPIASPAGGATASLHPSAMEMGMRSSAADVVKAKEAGAPKDAKERKEAPSSGAAVVDGPAKEKDETARRVAAIGAAAAAKAGAGSGDEMRAYAMVTQLSTLIHKTREELATVQEDNRRLKLALEEKLSDFERRLYIGEAQRALDAANATPKAPAESQGAPATATPSGKPVGGQKGVVAASYSPPGDAVAPSGVGPAPGARYRVQAASPGLAMLSEIDRSGEDVAPLQVAVGVHVPGYGKVTRISQRGAEWVVQTEKGAIR